MDRAAYRKIVISSLRLRKLLAARAPIILLLMILNNGLRIWLFAELGLSHYVVLLVVPFSIAIDLNIVVDGRRPIVANHAAVVVLLAVCVVE